MSWLIIAFISPICHGFANVLDNHLSNNLFKNTWTLMFYSVCFSSFFLPLLFLIQVPQLPPLSSLPFVFLIAFIEVFYLYPYYKALQSDDTSVVSSLFSLGKIFVPLFAFLFIGEILKPTQYLGFFIIILGSATLTLNNRGTLHLNKSFFYMLICSILLAVEAVTYKHLFENNVSWSTGFFWPTLFSTIIVLPFLLVPKLRREIGSQCKEIKRVIPFFAFEELLTFVGSATSVYALSMVPVTLVESIGEFQPLFVLFYAIVLHKIYPNLFRERIDRQSIIKKILLFGIMVIGILLVIHPTKY
ncbi:TPA: hypothetical protein DCW61_00330 [Candidatus Uhrbacteria bacterium]|nr:hypothetical protein [Candidatus Uhrbacteria bacterium]